MELKNSNTVGLCRSLLTINGLFLSLYVSSSSETAPLVAEKANPGKVFFVLEVTPLGSSLAVVVAHPSACSLVF